MRTLFDKSAGAGMHRVNPTLSATKPGIRRKEQEILSGWRAQEHRVG